MPKRDFWGSFAKEIDLMPTANLLSRAILLKGEREREDAEK